MSQTLRGITVRHRDLARRNVVEVLHTGAVGRVIRSHPSGCERNPSRVIEITRGDWVRPALYIPSTRWETNMVIGVKTISERRISDRLILCDTVDRVPIATRDSIVTVATCAGTEHAPASTHSVYCLTVTQYASRGDHQLGPHAQGALKSALSPPIRTTRDDPEDAIVLGTCVITPITVNEVTIVTLFSAL